MRTKGTYAKPSTRSKTSKDKATPPGKSIVRGLDEAAAWARKEISLRTRVINVPDDVDVHSIRVKSGLSQFQFAAHYGFNPRTLQDWEQGRSQPDSAVRAYLIVIDRNPAAVDKALRS